MLKKIYCILYRNKIPDFVFLYKVIIEELNNLNLNKEVRKEYIKFVKKYIGYYSNRDDFDDKFILIKLSYSLLKWHGFSMIIDRKYRESLNFYQALIKYDKFIEWNSNIIISNDILKLDNI